jgi:hypothetical protein
LRTCSLAGAIQRSEWRGLLKSRGHGWGGPRYVPIGLLLET